MFWNILVLAWVQADNACANAAVALVRDHDLLLSGSAPVPAHRGCSLALLVDCLWSRLDQLPCRLQPTLPGFPLSTALTSACIEHRCKNAAHCHCHTACVVRPGAQ